MMLAVFAVLTLAPLLALAYFSIQIASRSATSAARSRLVATTSVGAAYVQQQIAGLANVVRLEARQPALIDAAADGNYSNYRLAEMFPPLTDLQQASPGIQFAAISDPTSRQRIVVPESPTILGVDFTYRDWYVGVIRTHATYVSEAYRTDLPGNPLVVAVASPILGASGQTLAILLVGYRLDGIQALVSRLATSQGIALTVTDQAGTVVARPGDAPVALVSTNDPGVAAALGGQSSILQVSGGNVAYLRAYAPVADIGWTISASIPLSAALAGVYQLQGFVWVVTALLALISIAGLVWLGRLLRQRRLDAAALATSESVAMKARVTAGGVVALNRAKDELMSTVSHELRTPLASLVGFTELLVTRRYPQAEQKQYLTTMLEEGRRLTSLINDFLDLKRMESGKSPLVLAPLDLKALIVRAVAASGPSETTPIVVDISQELPLVRADADTITQVLSNVLSNARKYSPAGGAIGVKARVVDNSVEVTIQDSGLGIPPEVRHRLFETFFRVDNSDRRQISGTGLGLAICKRIIQSHGGTVSIDSAGLGMGSCVTFTLPIAREGAKSGDVLLVEDDAGFAQLLEAELATQGLSAVWAADAETAERIMEQMDARAVVLDLILPGKQGPEFLTWLRRGRGTGLPVVVVTVKSLSTKEIQAFQQVGVEAVLGKQHGGAKKAADLIAQALAAAVK
ncbi:MAG: ATP-binding protein [Candidatus Dormiibacterota bacterium]